VKILPAHWHGCIQRFDSVLAALDGAQVMVIGTEWSEYRDIPIASVCSAAPGMVVLDPNRFLSFLGTTTTLRYIAVGTPTLKRVV
jgi:hypothetical protein